jgi:hypothetical protein
VGVYHTASTLGTGCASSEAAAVPPAPEVKVFTENVRRLGPFMLHFIEKNAQIEVAFLFVCFAV